MLYRRGDYEDLSLRKKIAGVCVKEKKSLVCDGHGLNFLSFSLVFSILVAFRKKKSVLCDLSLIWKVPKLAAKGKSGELELRSSKNLNYRSQLSWKKSLCD